MCVTISWWRNLLSRLQLRFEDLAIPPGLSGIPPFYVARPLRGFGKTSREASGIPRFVARTERLWLETVSSPPSTDSTDKGCKKCNIDFRENGADPIDRFFICSLLVSYLTLYQFLSKSERDRDPHVESHHLPLVNWINILVRNVCWGGPPSHFAKLGLAACAGARGGGVHQRSSTGAKQFRREWERAAVISHA